MICADPESSTLDEDLRHKYDAMVTGSAESQLLRQRQRYWLKARNSCENIDCVRLEYRKRIAELTEREKELQDGAETEQRLSEISAEVGATVQWANQPDGSLVWTRPAARWCTDFLRDFLQHQNISTANPFLMDRGTLPIAVVDPGYSLGTVNGTKLITGYTTITWKRKVLILSVRGKCLGGSPQEVSECKGSSHWLQVFEWPKPGAQSMDAACNMSAGGIGVIPIPSASLIGPAR